jgi:tetratricopeptide (TPR) repeat protein
MSKQQQNSVWWLSMLFPLLAMAMFAYQWFQHREETSFLVYAIICLFAGVILGSLIVGASFSDETHTDSSAAGHTASAAQPEPPSAPGSPTQVAAAEALPISAPAEIKTEPQVEPVSSQLAADKTEAAAAFESPFAAGAGSSAAVWSELFSDEGVSKYPFANQPLLNFGPDAISASSEPEPATKGPAQSSELKAGELPGNQNVERAQKVVAQLEVEVAKAEAVAAKAEAVAAKLADGLAKAEPMAARLQTAEQLMQDAEVKQAKKAEQQAKKDEQQSKKDEQQSKRDEQQSKKDEQQSKKDEQQSKKDEQQSKKDGQVQTPASNPQVKSLQSSKATPKTQAAKAQPKAKTSETRLPDFKTVGEWLKYADKLMADENYDDAIRCYDQVTKLEIRSFDGWYLKAVALRSKGLSDDALYCINYALGVKNQSAEALTEKAYCLLDLGKSDQALVWFDKALSIDKAAANPWLGKGLCMAAMSRHKDAVACYDKALAIQPDNEDARDAKRTSTAKLGSRG